VYIADCGEWVRPSIFYAWDAETAEEKWRLEIDADNVASSILLVGDLAVFGCDRDGGRVADYSYDVKGTYDIFALPPTMFTLGAAGKAGAERHTQAFRAYTSRIAILKPILTAIKAEIAGRQR